MTPGDTTQGRRYPDLDQAEYSAMHASMEPGGYRHVEQRPGVWVWECTCLTGLLGSLGQHEVTVHEDGTITVSPSILIRRQHADGAREWHGYLERGVWREV